jgi:hypothetical protein
MLILKAPESRLMTLGCSKQFLDRLKRYINLLYVNDERVTKTKAEKMELFPYNSKLKKAASHACNSKSAVLLSKRNSKLFPQKASLNLE